jgi:hypothetical protein
MGTRLIFGFVFGFVGRDDLREALYNAYDDEAVTAPAMKKFHIEEKVTEFGDAYILYNSAIWMLGDADKFNSTEIELDKLSWEAELHNTSRFESFFDAVGIKNAGRPAWNFIGYKGE